jgi:hypothetical protein
MELGAVAVELDLMKPAVSAGDAVDLLGEQGLDEAQEGRLGPDRRPLPTLQRHWPNSTQQARGFESFEAVSFRVYCSVIAVRKRPQQRDCCGLRYRIRPGKKIQVEYAPAPVRRLEQRIVSVVFRRAQKLLFHSRNLGGVTFLPRRDLQVGRARLFHRSSVGCTHL